MNLFAPGSKNAELFSGLHKEPNDAVNEKHRISPFYKTNLESELMGIKDIIVRGILTNLCVRSTVQDAYDRDFNIKIISDSCVAMNNEVHEFTLKDLKETRPEIDIVSLQQMLQ